MDSILSDRIKAKFPNLVTEAFLNKGDSVIRAKKEGVRALCDQLKKDADFAFDMLIDLFAVDYLHWEEKAKRFELTYNLFSTTKNHRVFVKVEIDENEPEVDTVTPVWRSADWFERETWDMFGIRFKGHPNLKRILMYEQFVGHALRKDYTYNRRQPIIGPLN